MDHYFTDGLIDLFLYDLKDIDEKLNMNNWDLQRTIRWLHEESFLGRESYKKLYGDNTNLNGKRLA